jgi:hypothetical protein
MAAPFARGRYLAAKELRRPGVSADCRDLKTKARRACDNN